MSEKNFSTIELKVKLHGLIRDGCIDYRVTDLLFDDGIPLSYERQLWDFKLKQPTHTRSKNIEGGDKYHVEREWCELVKDVMSFYNSYGGYIIFGVSDSPRVLIGFDGEFDVDELNKRVSGYSKNNIECSFRRINVAPDNKYVGILLIPQRPDGEGIAIVRKDGPKDGAGRTLFTKGTVFLRKEDSCKPAEDPEDFQFLVSNGRRALSFATANPAGRSQLIHNNLPARDVSFIEFIGREKDLVRIWNWFLDEHSPLKLISGFGGVGKTTLVREFLEDVVRTAPCGIEKVVWLSAKQAVFTAIQDRLVPAVRVDFNDVLTLLKAILRELGELDVNFVDVIDKNELIDRIVDNLINFPTVLVVDDLDSLPLEFQQEAFHTLLHAFITAGARTSKSSKCMITARLDLGAAPSQLFKIAGLVLHDFSQYVAQSASYIELPWKYSQGSQIMNQFHLATEGSPIFADAVLRLVSLGENIETALKRWRGADGEEVRRYAFERELKNLTDYQIRTLYAAIVLGNCYLDELVVILNSNIAMLRDVVIELRKYHLISSGDSGAQGISLAVPSSLQLMRDVVRKRVQDPKRIDTECARLRSQVVNKSLIAERIARRVVAIWQDDNPEMALEVAKSAVKENSKVADLYCLLGRAYLRILPPDYKNGELNFREASNRGSDRQELLRFWIEAKIGLMDWKGLLDITASYVNDKKGAPVDIYMHRATAYRVLADYALKIGDNGSAAGWFKNGADEICRAFERKQAVGKVNELRELKNEFLSKYVFLINDISINDSDHLNVWLAVKESFDGFVRRPILLRLGFQKLVSWWGSVVRRGSFDAKALTLAQIQMEIARDILKFQRQYDEINGPELSIFMEEQINIIYESMEEYKNNTGV